MQTLPTYLPKLKGCAIFRTRVIRQKVSLKIVGFSMETPCWSPSDMVGHPFQNYDVVYVGFFAAYPFIIAMYGLLFNIQPFISRIYAYLIRVYVQNQMHVYTRC